MTMNDADRALNRIELLRLTKPNATMPDMAVWLDMANQLDAWVHRTEAAKTASPVVPTLQDPEPFSKRPGIARKSA
tara:strand:+ start:1396 stop:1623 length:228 start_codon:yes stop_codon:yes gene_type:complete